ncbi:DNA methylase [Nautilia profundicola AmH]|uniref:Methyltransferase n=1 Tax=Nautilia profundicola (strain ATCC BAA-1463 / DSM 18972 / AmH) TaxID=598659 RepID=B9L9Q0_NAUPA|nr:site-specific DNA-methyltransferase [Nautilia profundicola]ACM93755.1 DNA methylase [Nautilia profundicola AmH]
METKHILLFKNSQNTQINNESIDFILTSPPYPMIEMWDETFFKLNQEIKNQFNKKNYRLAYELMHNELNKTWKECYRVLKPGGIIAINIGDATRTLNKNFQLFTNHVKIIEYMQNLGMQSLPPIIWRKTSNKPNKFMGSGMLPVNAYVTLEHEYILIFRKGEKRKFNKNEIIRRRKSAFFWEERNKWFSDIWKDIVGENQTIDKYYKTNRDRNAAFPLELSLRLIHMFSIYEDTVFDPFLGTGTTTIASAVLGRNSIGYEIDTSFKNLIKERINNIKTITEQYINNRINSHKKFIENYIKQKNKAFKYYNENLKTPVMTSQEKDISFYQISNVQKNENLFICKYSNFTPFLI